jgi:segregation and condensation protein B
MDIDLSTPHSSLLAGLIEALLFASSSSVSINQLASVLDIHPSEVETALQELEASYKNSNPPRFLRLQKFQNRYQLTTAAEVAPLIEQFFGLEYTSRLSQAGLETLAVIAYRQPITRPQIDAIRGVNSDGVLKTLLSKGLIQEVGRAEAPGRPILYSVTTEFLQYFGLNSLDELPPWEDNETQTQSENEDPST